MNYAGKPNKMLVREGGIACADFVCIQGENKCFLLLCTKTSFSGVNNWALQYSCMLESRYSYTSPMLPSFHDSYHLQNITLCRKQLFVKNYSDSVLENACQ